MHDDSHDLIAFLHGQVASFVPWLFARDLHNVVFSVFFIIDELWSDPSVYINSDVEGSSFPSESHFEGSEVEDSTYFP